MKNDLIGESAEFLAVLDKVSLLAPIERPVLITGERGTGKELIAQRLHYLSSRWEKPMITMNCGALSEGVIDSELFGHESGAFTGSKGRHRGRFERAESGSLFLDELANAPLNVQEKLLRVIEYGEYERVGGSQTLKANVRMICATNENLLKLAEQQKFRADLLDRLAFDVIHLPPLRARHEDILPLAEHYAIRMSREMQLSCFPGFSDNALRQLFSYHWPGNIRELKNVVERAVCQHQSEQEPIPGLILNPFESIWADDKTSQQSPEPENVDNGEKEQPTLPVNLKDWLDSQEQQLIHQALQQAKYNQRNAAELLGLSYHQLRGLIRKYQILINKPG
ncbi:Psp operon transcriptional activator [Vibrio aerogenes CECT 7868]|uniref:Psp operon transcriptional activator n=1 Tax=Vibrio aerogenes CECT 7868 TaxID=1216006 RepID=A0A1M6DUR1_9VIBR|nr:phage shock protein operon transcriptional activator [Vibrio aerogenes]SHI77007.1 Psp operon transcriptional activator [Vibrio aerogenes CECT 7868]